MSLRSVNLNLLPVLQSLLRERSVSDAADVLAMSQSAASEALAKLRATFDDPLLVRVGLRMELTPRALSLVDPLDELCRGLEAFHRRPQFDARGSERTFTISGNDYAIRLIGPRLLERLRDQAPGVSVRFLASGAQLVSQLVTGEVDFAMIPGFVIADLPADTLRQTLLFKDRAVVIFDRNHPLAKHPTVSKADLGTYRMIAYHPGAMKIERRHLHAFSGGEPFRVAAFVPDVELIPELVRGSEDFGILPERFRKDTGAFPDIVARPLAYAMPALEVSLAWGPLQHSDSGHRWLRERILETAAECVAATDSISTQAVVSVD